jgi:hypothetical protein
VREVTARGSIRALVCLKDDGLLIQDPLIVIDLGAVVGRAPRDEMPPTQRGLPYGLTGESGKEAGLRIARPHRGAARVGKREVAPIGIARRFRWRGW